jgi:hypothetical protein
MAEKKKKRKNLKKYLLGKAEEEKRDEGKRGIPPRGCGWSVCRTARQINDRAKYVDYGNTSPTCMCSFFSLADLRELLKKQTLCTK